VAPPQVRAAQPLTNQLDRRWIAMFVKLTVREAARLLSVSETEIYRWVEDGAIPCYTVRHQPLFSRAELLEWATTRRMPVSVELFAGGGRSPRLADALARGGVYRDVPGTDRASVLRAVVDRLPLPDPADRELVLPILIAREQHASTGIGDGIAIPHVRMPLVFAGHEAAISLCYLAQPIPYGAIDGKPVHTVFAMLTPTVRGHLQLLSRLSHGLFDAGFLAAVSRKAPIDEIVAEARRVDAGLPEDDDEADDDEDDGEPEVRGLPDEDAER
jgi:PTS system nitrogen regulatory IIA component